MWLLGGVDIRSTDPFLQSFTMSSAKGKPVCSEAPRGVLLQSVDNDVSLVINKAEITLTGTALISVPLPAPPGGDMTIQLFDGKVNAKVGDKTTTLDKAGILSIHLDKKGDSAQPVVVKDEPVDDPAGDLLSKLPPPNDGPNRVRTAKNSIDPMSGRWKNTTQIPTHTCEKNPYAYQDKVVTDERIFTLHVPFSIRNYVEEASGVLPLTNVEFSNPEPNHYKWNWQQGTFHVNNDLVVRSPKQMKLTNQVDFGKGCVVTFDVTLDWIGEK
jgi:hypothetical protein